MYSGSQFLGIIAVGAFLAILLIAFVNKDKPRLHGTAYDVKHYCLESGFSDYEFSKRRAYCTHGVKPTEIVPKSIYGFVEELSK